MTDCRQMSLSDYLDAAAAGQPTPGGGSVSALAGALGASMAEMAANFTAGRKKFAAVEAEVRELLAEVQRARRELLDAVQADTRAYAAVAAALSMPRQTEEQKAARRQALSAACRAAMAVPLEAVHACCRAMAAARRLAETANPNLISDVGVAALLLEAAAKGAALNVVVNLPSIGDEALSAEVGAEVEAALGECVQLGGQTVQLVQQAMRGGAS